MESVHRGEDRQSLDVNDLLSNGFWKTSRSHRPSSSSYPHTLTPTYPPTTNHQDTRRPSRSPRRSRPGWPPQPSVEDETIALAKEQGGSRHSTTQDPPCKGLVDQQPIILESDASPTEAGDFQQTDAQADNGERRFVLMPHTEDDKEHGDGLHDARAKKAQPPQQESVKRTDGPGLAPAPPLARRRSRQELSSLKTKVEPEMPPYRRSTSAYAYIPKGQDSAKTSLTASMDTLSPNTISSGKDQVKNYFELAAQSLPRKYSAASPASSRPGTPVEEKRRSTGPLPTSRPGTPTSEKRNGGSDGYSRPRPEVNEKMPRPQKVAEQNGAPRKSSQHLSAEPERRYSSSDDDLSDSGRRHRHRRSHSRQRGQSNLRPEDDRNHHHHHHRTPSGRFIDPKNVPKASSLPSPKVSPSQPSAEKRSNQRKDGYSSGREGKRPLSRAGSPVSDHSDPSRSSRTLNPNEVSRSARGHSRRPSPVNAADPRASSATLPIPIPLVGDGPRSPTIPRYDEDPIARPASARPVDAHKPNWPPAFQPSNSEPAQLSKPVGSYRRHSQDVEDGHIAPLPPCPRTLPTRGKSDWLTLPKAPAFNICPSCFNSSIAPTEFRSRFVQAPPRPPHEDVICDFGIQPWYRIAWLLTRKERLKDLRLLYSIADVSENSQPCLGRHEAVRRWHSVIDPETRMPIKDFDVCSSCVKCLEALLPPLRGIFVRTNNSDLGHPRQCDLRFDSKRFVHYFDALETMADETIRYRGPPDTQDFADLARKFAKVPECPRDNEVANSRWYLIRELPEFTVCPECWEEVVSPARRKGKAIASMFNKAPQTISTPNSCQLYSPRMRAIFDKAVHNDDYKLLTTKARDRKRTELDLKADITEQRRLSPGSKAAAIELARLENEWKEWE